MAATPQSTMDVKDLHDFVEGLEQHKGPDIDQQIDALVSLLNESRLYVAPSQDIVATQQETRKRIKALGDQLSGLMDPEVQAKMGDLERLVEQKYTELNGGTPVAPVAPAIVPVPVVATPATPIPPATAATTAPAAATPGPSTGPSTGSSTGPSTGPSSGPTTITPDDFLTRTLESGSDKAGEIVRIIEGKINAAGVDLNRLARFIGTPSLRLSEDASKIINEKDIDANTVEGRLEGKKRELQEAKDEMEDARNLTGNAAGAAAAKQTAMNNARGAIKLSQKAVNALEEALTYLSRNRTYKPRELLMMVNHFLNPNETKTNIARMTDNEIAGTRRKVDISNWQNNGALGILRPTLKETLQGFCKIPELEGIAEEKMTELSKISGNPTALKKWVEKLEGGEENYSKVIPALLAYLEAAMVDEEGNTGINSLSQKYFKNLVDGLRKIRNDYFAKKVEKEHPAATNQEKMLKYFAMLNQSDETTVDVDRQILKDILTKSYLKAGTKLAAAPIAAYYAVPMLGWSAITSTLGFLGWGNIVAGGAYLGARPHLKSEFAKNAALRGVALCTLGPIGLIAPELFNVGKSVFNHKESIKKGASATGAVAKGVGKVIAAPFKAGAAVVRGFKGKKAA